MKYVAVLMSVVFVSVMGFWLTNSHDEDQHKPITNDQFPTNAATSQASEAGPAQVKSISAEELSVILAEADTHQEGFAEFIQTVPHSLVDVPAPSPLNLDTEGNLLIDANVKMLFEHYLSAMGEESLENVLIRIKHSLESQLSGLALEEGLLVLEGYIQYRNHLGVMKNDYALTHTHSSFSLAAVKEMQANVKDARLSFFDERAIEGLFSKEDEYNDYMMHRAEIRADSQLSAEEKTAQLADLKDTAPEWILETLSPTERLDALRQTTSARQQDGASTTELYQLREAEFGHEAAERLQTLDIKRAEWQQKVSDYRQELNALLAHVDPSEVDIALVKQVRENYFNAQEMNRIAAIDKIELNIK